MEFGAVNTIDALGSSYGLFDADLIRYEPNQVVPEPGSLTLLCLGLVSFAGAAWRKRRMAV